MVIRLADVQPTFKTRVETFWKWYAQQADQFYETIERGQCRELADDVGRFMAETLPHLSWVFGPGEGGGHSFTVTGEGHVPKQLLAEYWHACAPEIPRWTFYASRQPTPVERLKDFEIGFGGQESVDAESFQLAMTVDNERELIDLVAWHEALAQVDEEAHMQILFLLLDEALGEFGTQTWIGKIDVEPIVTRKRVISLCELPQFVEQVNRYHQWKKLPPLKSYSLYDLAQQTNSPRGDTIIGSSVIPREVFELIDNNGRLPEDPLEDTGAQFVYLAIDSQVFPDGKQSDVRGNIEDALDEALEDQASGRTLGGAFGINETYIDLLLLDGNRSMELVRQTLTGLQLGGRFRIAPFA